MATKETIIDISDPKSVKKAIDKMERARTRVKKLRNHLEEIVQEVDVLYLRKLRRVLATYPAPRNKLRPRFSSQKQHDYVMYMWRTRKIQLPHQRTGELAASWEVKARVTENKIELKIDTNDGKAQFVVGKVGISPKKSDIKKYEAPIQPFARDNGWRPVHTVVRPTVVRVQKYINARMEEWEDHLLD